ncbi:MAG: hypothetical protein KC466_09620 [Myxococcales bacterium]|nr:hypothetical protein [Myxococcales bacterium]
MTSVTNPSLSLRRDFAVTGDRTVSTSPYPEPPLTSGGAISSNSAYHPVFSLFQSCFGVGPGAHLSFPGACTMDAVFWDRFYTEACKASPYSLSISMGGAQPGLKRERLRGHRLRGVPVARPGLDLRAGLLRDRGGGRSCRLRLLLRGLRRES